LGRRRRGRRGGIGRREERGRKGKTRGRSGIGTVNAQHIRIREFLFLEAIIEELGLALAVVPQTVPLRATLCVEVHLVVEAVIGTESAVIEELVVESFAVEVWRVGFI
jgi:hypothetical protein